MFLTNSLDRKENVFTLVKDFANLLEEPSRASFWQMKVFTKKLENLSIAFANRLQINPLNNINSKFRM